jgi:hypothetical protein
MAAIYSNGGNRWNILGFNLSSVYKISMIPYFYFNNIHEKINQFRSAKSSVFLLKKKIQ